ncbi:hypothetical protein BS78_07G126400 [Paspalum vaginatum]|nr:hypothetical protein BS78_07G126400 [Paspalum vaginatum]
MAETSACRDWSELPLDALASIFGKLGGIEILMGTGLVCRSWLQAAKVPELWRCVYMARHKVVDELDGDALCAMARVAVDRAAGQLQVFQGKGFVTDELLKYIGERSPDLKGLVLVSCDGVSNNGFTELVTRCRLLLDLHLVFCDNVGGRDVYEATGKACAQLKRFRLRKGWSWSLSSTHPSAGEALGVAAMHELRSLSLLNTGVTNDELASILDGCPHLELLDLTDCFNIVVDDALKARCAGIESLTFPEVDDHEDCWEPLSSRDVDFASDNSD